MVVQNLWPNLNEVAPADSPKHSKEYAMNKDQVNGRVKEAKGKVKEVTGRVLGDKTMENKGKLRERFPMTPAAGEISP